MVAISVLLQTLRIRLAAMDERGQGLAEYGLILALIAVVAVAALTGLGGAIVSELSKVTADL
jgi:pilus assembly protein Flp/PilA